MSPGWQFFIGDPARREDYYARYAECLVRWNAEHPEVPIDINCLHWYDRNWVHLNPPGSIHPVAALEELKRIRSP